MAQVLIPNISFVGHLSGVLVGLIMADLGLVRARHLDHGRSIKGSRSLVLKPMHHWKSLDFQYLFQLRLGNRQGQLGQKESIGACGGGEQSPLRKIEQRAAQSQFEKSDSSA